MATSRAQTRAENERRSSRPFMPLLRLALALAGAAALAGGALAQSDGATPLPPQRPAASAPSAPPTSAAPDPGQQATMMPAPDVAPPPGIGQLDQIAAGKGFDPTT